MSKKLLVHPRLDKHSWYKDAQTFRVGASAMQGWRRSMEDSNVFSVINSPEMGEIGIFAIFDGHNGDTTSTYLRDHFIENLLETRTAQPSSAWPDVLVNTFITIDKRCAECSASRYEGSGSTAIAVIICRGIAYIANAGDCRCVVGTRVNGKLSSVALSQDHKPDRPTEKARIEMEGATVSEGRINGVLSVSRAVGDYEFKKKVSTPGQTSGDIVTVVPDVQTRVIENDDEFLFLASDGIWECVENCDEIVRRIGDLSSTSDLTLAIEKLFDTCVSVQPVSPGLDNMSGILIQIKK